jgi:hypothetical protein
MSLHNNCFRFEAEFSGNLRCLPMAVRRKLDLAGVKLKLSHWAALEPQERRQLLAWGDDAEATASLRAWLLERTAALADGPAKAIEPARGASWQQGEAIPPMLAAACAQIGASLLPQQWQGLDELQRFTLVKLSHPGHEHRNLPHALAEFLTNPDCS